MLREAFAFESGGETLDVFSHCTADDDELDRGMLLHFLHRHSDIWLEKILSESKDGSLTIHV